MAKKKLDLPKAKCVERIDLTHDLAIFKFNPEIEFSFTPGQYATIGMEDGERLIERPYSIVSSPHEELLELFIELVPEGELTPPLFHKLQVGDFVTLRPRAKGRFTLDPGSQRHLMIATVTGIAPFISMIRTSREEMRRHQSRPPLEFFVMQGASRSWEFCYKDELERLAREVSWLQYVPTVSRPWEDTTWGGETGRVETKIEKYVEQWGLHPDDTTAYACGHPGMIKNAKAILTNLGFPKEKLREEQYWTQNPEAES